MSCIIGLILLSSSLSYAFPLPNTVDPIAPISPVPSPFPIGPTPRPIGPVFNNLYPNYERAPVVPILSYSNEHNLDGNYAFSFATADGKQVEENGYLKDAFIDKDGNPQGTQVVRGSYSYISPDGTPIQVSYVADEKGFRPSVVHVSANRKPVLPHLSLSKDNRYDFDPRFDHYNNHFLYPNRLYGQYNNGHHYDPRYPYDSLRFNPYYNNYKLNQIPTYNNYKLNEIPTTVTTTVKPEVKKESA